MTPPTAARGRARATPEGPNVDLLNRWVEFPDYGAFYKVEVARDGYHLHKAATTENPLPVGPDGHQALEADYVGPIQELRPDLSDDLADTFGVRFPPNVEG